MRTAAGGAEFALTSVHYHLAARHELAGSLAARFVAVIHQRSPLAAFVPLDSPLRSPDELGGRRIGRSATPWFELEYRAGLAQRGLAPPVIVPPDAVGNHPSLARGELDAIGSWHEAVAVIRRSAGIPVRPIPFGPPVYTTGLVAADAVEPDVVARMVRALTAAFRRQRRRPGLGLDALCRRFPTVEPERVAEEWSILEHYVFADARPAAMDEERWAATLDHVCAAHGFGRPPVAAIAREELVATTRPAPALVG